jgi:hypothetical protein
MGVISTSVQPEENTKPGRFRNFLQWTTLFDEIDLGLSKRCLELQLTVVACKAHTAASRAFRREENVCYVSKAVS